MIAKTPLLLLLLSIPFIVAGQRLRRTPIPLGTPADTCAKSTSEKLYGGPGNDVGTQIRVTSDGGYLLVGSTNSFGAGGMDGYVVKLDNTGSVQWSKTYGGSTDDAFNQFRATADGGYILGGYTTSFGDPAGDAWLVKIDANGNMQWSKKYGDGNPNGDRLFDLIQTADGGYAFVGDHKYTPGIVDAMVVRTDATGNLLWSKAFDSFGTDECSGIYEDRDSLVVSAFYQSTTGYDAVLMKIEEVTGTISWLKSWDFDDRTNRVSNIFPQLDGYLVYGVNSDGFGVTNPWQSVIKTDFNGNLIWTRELNTTPTTMNGYIYPTTDSGYVIENDELTTDPNADIHFTKVRKDGSVAWSKQYPQPGQQIQGGIVQTGDGGYAGLAYTDQSGIGVDLLLIKTDSLGQTTGCTNNDVQAAIRNPVVNYISYAWLNLYDIVWNPSLAITPTVTSPVTADSPLCITFSYCLDLQIKGMDSICTIQNAVSYLAIRDSGCVTPVQWSVDPAYANVVAQTDTTIRLQYLQPGATTIHGQITSACGIVQDSLPVNVFHPTPIDLGNDTIFCPGGAVLLNAGSGFQSYSWSTGATTQQLTDSSQETIWVAAINPGNGCLSTDTINIDLYPFAAVNIGPDTSICQDSLYTFNAGPGFNSYLWQDGSSGPSFTTDLAGSYWVTVTNLQGCSASDTARILRVSPNPADFLQPTAEICSKGQLPLQVTAIGTWRRYLWSNGATGPAITIDAPGEYYLQVANAAGCTAIDSIAVSGKACPFGIFFPNAFSPNNDGNNDVFRPKVYAALDKFYMAIYNRWGVRVFETTDPNKGWDGTFNGQQQNTGTFVWYAQYHVQGISSPGITEKGTLILIR